MITNLYPHPSTNPHMNMNPMEMSPNCRIPDTYPHPNHQPNCNTYPNAESAGSEHMTGKAQKQPRYYGENPKHLRIGNISEKGYGGRHKKRRNN